MTKVFKFHILAYYKFFETWTIGRSIAIEGSKRFESHNSIQATSKYSVLTVECRNVDLLNGYSVVFITDNMLCKGKFTFFDE